MEKLVGDLRHIDKRVNIDVNSKFMKDALSDKQLKLFKKIQHNKSDWANDVYAKYIRPSLLKHAKSLYFAKRPDFYT